MKSIYICGHPFTSHDSGPESIISWPAQSPATPGKWKSYSINLPVMIHPRSIDYQNHTDRQLTVVALWNLINEKQLVHIMRHRTCYADRTLVFSTSTPILPSRPPQKQPEIYNAHLMILRSKYIAINKEDGNNGNVNFSGSQSGLCQGDHDSYDKAWTERHVVYGSSYPGRLPPA